MINQINKILQQASYQTEINRINELSTDKIDVLINVDDSPEDKSEVLEILFIDAVEKATDGLAMLQFFITLNFKISSNENVKTDLLKVLSEINYTLATGSFNVKIDQGYVFLKYNLSLIKESESELKPKVLKIVWLLNRHLNVYHKILKNVASGTLPYTEIMTNKMLP